MPARNREFKYEQLARQLALAISSGTLRAGDRMPSIRKLRRQQRTSISTVLNAFFLLERKGLIEARQRSGFFVKPPVIDLPPEPRAQPASLRERSVATSDLVVQICRENFGEDVLPLGTASPGAALLDAPALLRTGSSILRRQPQLMASYGPLQGSEALRREIAKRMMTCGVAATSGDIVTTAGAAEAMTLCLRAVTSPGDAVAIESPAYFIVLQALELLHLKAIEIPASSGSGMDLSLLERAIRGKRVKACVVMPNFQNPLGSLMPVKNKKRILQLLSKRDIPLVEDDVYGDLTFTGERPGSIKAFDKDGLVLYCSSFSKTLGPGFRTGWVMPGRFQKEFERLKLVSTIGTPVLTEAMIAEYLKHGSYDRHLRKLSRAFMEQVRRTQEIVVNYFPKGTRMSRPEGGFLLWVELRKGTDSLALYSRLIDEGISISPGPLFSSSGKFRNFIRLNCGLSWSARVERALVRIGQLCADLSPLK